MYDFIIWIFSTSHAAPVDREAMRLRRLRAFDLMSGKNPF